MPKAKSEKRCQLVVPIEPTERAKLEKEAAADQRTLAAYVRKLLSSHPDRMKK